MSWSVQAACGPGTGQDPELWFPISYTDATGIAQTAYATSICHRCPVRAECLTDAMAIEGNRGEAGRHGIRGGLAPVARAHLYARTRRPAEPGVPVEGCGDAAGYQRHRRAGTTPCKACSAAERERAAQAAARREPAECGTRSGYQRHRRDGQEACDPCKAANAAADRRLATTGTTKAAA